MGMFDSNIDYTKLIQFTGGSVRIATFVEIRDAFTKRYKEIYGNDIDVSTASADGQFINEMSLILNNILQCVQFAFDSLDPAVATGKYLDVICSYNNIQRISQSPSVAELYIYNSSPAGSGDLAPLKLIFIDRGGLTWEWDNTLDLNGDPETKFPPGASVPITGVRCDFAGAIQAPGAPFNGDDPDDVSENNWDELCPGWIYQLVDASPLKVWQRKDAVVGNEDETDDALRSRRYQMLGNQSVSVLEGLKGSLLNISGIEDVYIFNNMDDAQLPLTPGTADPIADGTYVLGHTVYITIRVKEGVVIEDSLIGKLIYNKLTPGIGTTPAKRTPSQPIPTSSECKSYKIQRTPSISYTVYWKQAKPISPAIVLTFKYTDAFDYKTENGSIAEDEHEPYTDMEKAMASKLIEALSKVSISSYAQPSLLMTAVQQADKQKMGRPTFFVCSCMINESSDNYPANLSYFKYSLEDALISYDDAAKEGYLNL